MSDKEKKEKKVEKKKTVRVQAAQNLPSFQLEVGKGVKERSNKAKIGSAIHFRSGSVLNLTEEELKYIKSKYKSVVGTSLIELPLPKGRSKPKDPDREKSIGESGGKKGKGSKGK